jgi:hypothetical protein
MESVIVAQLERTIAASCPAIVRIFPCLLVRVWKYLVFLSIVLVVPLSTRHISSIGFNPVEIFSTRVFSFLISSSADNVFESGCNREKENESNCTFPLNDLVIYTSWKDAMGVGNVGSGMWKRDRERISLPAMLVPRSRRGRRPLGNGS